MLNIFPPLLFNRIILKEIADDFSEMKVVLKKALFNINLQRTIFGGSIFSAFDPYFPTMYYYIFFKRKLIIWVKSAEIQYRKPAKSNLNIHFKISKNEIQIAKKNLNEKGKFEISHNVEARSNDGILCAKAKIKIYLRDQIKLMNLV